MADVSVLFSLLATNDTGAAVAAAADDLASIGTAAEDAASKATAAMTGMSSDLAKANAQALAEWKASAAEMASAEREAYAEDADRAAAAGEESGEKFGGGFAESVKSIVEAAGLFEGFDFLKESVEGAETAQVTYAQTGQILQSTGDIAGTTADQVQQLSDKYGELAGVQGVTVQNSLNTLLRSSGVQDAIQSGVVTTDQLTGTLVNMAAAMSKGGDTSASLGGAASALSKALADPYTAAKALTAAGDPLTASQVAQIAAFKKSGDEAGAYQVVLDSLASSTAGAAAANTTPMQQLAATYADLKDQVGTDLIPVVDKLAQAFESAAPDIASVMGALSDGIGFIVDHGDVFGPLAAGAAAAYGAYKTLTTAMTIYKGVQDGINAVLALFDAEEATADAEEMANPYVLLAAVLVALGVAFYELYEHCTAFRDGVNDVVHAVAGYFEFLWNAVTGVFNAIEGAVSDVVGWIEDHWHLLLAILLGPFGLFIDAVQVHWQAIEDGISDLIGWVEDAWGALEPILVRPFQEAWSLLQPVFSKLDNWIDDFMSGMQELGGVIEGVWNGIVDAIRGAFDAIYDAFEASGIPQVLSALSSIASATGGIFGSALNSVGSFFGFAEGGTVGQGGYAIVGENGPELALLPGGTQVIPNGAATVASRSTSVSVPSAQGGVGVVSGGGSANVTLTVAGNSSDILVQMLRKYVRANGGNVQTVLGK
jgi:phage-related protein